jgi:hypothetical protein
MELLDSEEKQFNPAGKTLGYVGAIFYSIGGMACTINIYYSWLYFSAFARTGIPDTSFTKNGFEMAIYPTLIADIALIIALICQRRAYFRYHYCPTWLWWIILVSSILGILSWLMPTNPLIAIIAVANFFHLYKRKKRYFKFSENQRF